MGVNPMADGALTVQVDGDLAEEVKAAAAAKGISFEAYVREAIIEACRQALNHDVRPEFS